MKIYTKNYVFWILTLFYILPTSVLWAQNKKEILAKLASLPKCKNDLEAIYLLEYIFEGKITQKVHEDEDLGKKMLMAYTDSILQKSGSHSLKVIMYAKFSREALHFKNNSAAIDYIKKAEKMMPKGNSIIQFYLQHKKYELYANLKKRDTALYYVKKMEEIAYQLKNDSLQNLALRNLGGMFFGNKKYADSREVFKKVIQYNQKYKTQTGLNQNINCINTVALAFRIEKQYDSAHYYYTQALDLAKVQKDTAWIALITGNMADIHFLEKKYEKALPLFLKELALVTRNKHKEKRVDGRIIGGSTVNTISRLASIYLALNDKKSAKMYLDSAENNLLNQDFKSIKMVFGVASEYYEKEGNFEKAHQYYKKYHALTDSINNQEAIAQANELNAQLNFDKQQKEIEQLHQIADKQAKENAQTTQILFGVMAVLGLSVWFIYFLYQSNEQKKEVNAQLRLQKEEIITQAEELNMQAEELRTLNDQLVELDQFKQNLTGMIVHDLKNPLNALLNLSETPSPNQAQIVRNYSQQMLNMVMNMLDVQRFEEANMHLDLQEIGIVFLVGEACGQVDFMLVQKNIKVEHKIPQDLYTLADAEILVRVFVNLLTNAIKYSPQNSKIYISTEQQETGLLCKIQDEGKGVPEDKAEYIFQKFTQLEADARKNYGSTGLGLTFCKMAIEAHEGNIGVTSEAGKGATFWFTLPTALQKETLPTQPTPQSEEKIVLEATLSAQSIEILRPFLPELSKLEVYYASELEAVLSKIDFAQSQDLQAWEDELKTAIYNFNQVQYQHLLAQIV